MSSLLILFGGFACLFLGYVTYGSWLSKQWGVDNSKPTPAHTMQDGVDYVPAKAPVLLGHHFSSIAGAGPINGPIQAAFFGWLPCLLWIIVGGIFFGAVHDTALCSPPSATRALPSARSSPRTSACAPSACSSCSPI